VWLTPQVGNIDEALDKVITGIIEAILGLIVALNVIRKTTPESRKLELEIRQKQTEFSETRDVLLSARADVGVSRLRKLGRCEPRSSLPVGVVGRW
jgi:hypothetical protein